MSIGYISRGYVRFDKRERTGCIFLAWKFIASECESATRRLNFPWDIRRTSFTERDGYLPFAARSLGRTNSSLSDNQRRKTVKRGFTMLSLKAAPWPSVACPPETKKAHAETLRPAEQRTRTRPTQKGRYRRPNIVVALVVVVSHACNFRVRPITFKTQSLQTKPFQSQGTVEDLVRRDSSKFLLKIRLISAIPCSNFRMISSSDPNHFVGS